MFFSVFLKGVGGGRCLHLQCSDCVLVMYVRNTNLLIADVTAE